MEKLWEVSALISGRPSYQVSAREKDCYDLLDKLNIGYERVDYNRPPQNQDELLEVDQRIGVEGIKNLVFQNKKKNRLYFLIVPRDERVNIKSFSEENNLGKISMASESTLKNLLNTRPGAVGVMELIYDKDKLVELFIDERVLKKEYMRFHPNENTSTLRIKMNDFLNILMPYFNYKINIIKKER